MFFAVRLKRGGPWDWSRGLREQDGFDQHARFMDSLVDDGFVVLGGPLAGEREILHAISAPSEQSVRERLAEDNWHQNGMLRIESIEPWTVLLDGRETPGNHVDKKLGGYAADALGLMDPENRHFTK